MKNNATIRIVRITLLIIALVLLFILFKSKPSIMIRNNTSKVIYIYVMERGSSNEEPSVQEVEQLKKARAIKSKSELTITPSLGSLLKENIVLDIGWRVGGRAESLSGSGSQGFSMGSENGACHYSIQINKGKSEWQKEQGNICIKKIAPLNQEIEKFMENKSCLHLYERHIP